MRSGQVARRMCTENDRRRQLPQLDPRKSLSRWGPLGVHQLRRSAVQPRPPRHRGERNALDRRSQVKMNKEMGSADVQGKREAAKRWANHVTADATVGTTWRYLLVSEDDVTDAKGSWAALKRLGT